MSGEVTKINNGDIIRAKIHAKIGTIVIIGVGDLGRPNSKECIGGLLVWALDVLKSAYVNCAPYLASPSGDFSS